MKFWKWEITISRPDEELPNVGGRVEEIEYPEPGRLYDWMLQETKKFEEQARKGQIYQTHLADFTENIREAISTVAANKNYDKEIKADADNVELQFSSRLEWIHRSQQAHEKWRAKRVENADKNDEYGRAAMPQIQKYILIAYGAAFLFIFNSFISGKLPPTDKAPLIFSMYVLLTGFLIAIAYIWWVLKVAIGERDYAMNQFYAWDPDDVKKNWWCRHSYWTNILIFFAIAALPIAGLSFIEGVGTVNTPKTSTPEIISEIDDR